MARPTLGRTAGAADAANTAREFPGAARRAHAALRRAGGGLVRAVAVGARRREQGHTPRDARASSTTRRCRPVATAGASSRPWPTRPPACGACRCSIGSPTIATPSLYPVPTGGRWRRASAGRRCSICPPAARATGCGGSGRTDVRSLEGHGRRVVRAARGVAATAAAWPSSSDRTGNGTWRSCRRTAPTPERWPRPSTSKVRGPGHRRLVAGRHMDRRRRHDAQGRLVQDSRGRRRARSPRRRSGSQSGLVAGRQPDRVCRPVVAGQVRCWACDRTAPRSSCRTCRSAWAAIASCPTERAWCTCRALQSLDFWLLDLATQTTRQLTRLSNQGACGRSTSRPTANTSSSTARARTPTSS